MLSFERCFRRRENSAENWVEKEQDEIPSVSQDKQPGLQLSFGSNFYTHKMTYFNEGDC